MSVCVIGAGVAGLTCASLLHAAGVPVTVLEAATRPGGRVHSARDAAGQYLGDLGPSWVWPPYQPVLAAWLDRLGVDTIEQYERGDGCIERVPGAAPARAPLPAQHGQRRPLGGPQAMVDALVDSLPAGTLLTERCVVSVKRSGDRWRLSVEGAEQFEAEEVVLAVPPRVALQRIAFDPPLPPDIARLCENAPTWMAAQAKALVVYETPFWRTDGLSGRISSALGPLFESHDHSGPDGTPAALVGFVGIDARTRERVAAEHGEAALGDALVEQLVRCFGESARDPQLLRIEDWARNPLIATPLDIDRPSAHPQVLPPALRGVLSGSGLHFAVAEVAEVSPGLLEGAFAAGERVAQRLLAAH